MTQTAPRKLIPYLGTLAVYQLMLAVAVAVYGYRDSFLITGNLHAPWLDMPMFLLTHLGDALILTSLLGLLLIRKKPDVVLMLVIVVLITGLAGQLLKNTVFDGWDRPLRVLGEAGNVHTMFGYRLFHNAFPSGHSITVAAAMTVLVMSLKVSVPVQVLLAVLTAIISFTRIYVGAHFPGDVLAGTILGVAGALFLTGWLQPGLSRWIGRISETAGKRLKIMLFILAISGIAGGIWMINEFLVQL